MANGSTDDGYYFRSPNIIAVILVPIGMTLTTMAALSPQLLPYAYMGPLGNLVNYLVQNHPGVLTAICVAAWLAHAGEALYAGQLCSNKQIGGTTRAMWMLQTFVYGIFSLSFLLKYKPGKKSS